MSDSVETYRRMLVDYYGPAMAAATDEQVTELADMRTALYNIVRKMDRLNAQMDTLQQRESRLLDRLSAMVAGIRGKEVDE